MDVIVKGSFSGIEVGDSVTKIEIVWKTGEETEAQAVTAGRFVDLVAPADNTKIAAYWVAGASVAVPLLVHGTAYTPAVRITETRADLSVVTGAWTDGGVFTPDTLVTFDADFGYYQNMNPAMVTLDTTVKRSGVASCRIESKNNTTCVGTLKRPITLPATGTVTVNRWFRYAASAANAHFALFQLMNSTEAANLMIVRFNPTIGVGYYNGASYTSIYSIASMAADTWYKITINFDVVSKSTTVTLFSDTDTQLATVTFTNFAALAGVAAITNLGGAVFVPVVNAAVVVWIDDCDNGTL